MPSPTKSRLPADEEILNLKYKLLSDVKRTPAAGIYGKGTSYGGNSLSPDGTLMSSNANLAYSLNGTMSSTRGGGGGGSAAGGGDSPRKAGGNSNTTNDVPPGPGAYLMPAIWTPTKGPTRWQPEMYPYGANSPKEGPKGNGSQTNTPRGSPNSSRRGFNSQNVASTSAMYLPPTPKGKAFSMSSRWDGPQPKHDQLPGPGSYEPLKSAFSPNKHVKKCVFGLRPKPLESLMKDNPGPGTYEAVTDATLQQQNGATYKTTRMAGKWSDPTPPKSPHALTYKVPAPFDQTPTGHVTTIKGRLDHPMDDHNAGHEAAKTDRPHEFDRRFKSKPVA